MSQHDVHIVQSIYDAYITGNVAPVFEVLDPEIDFIIPDSLPYGGIYHGFEGAQQLFLAIQNTWEYSQVTPERIVSREDLVIAFARLRGKIRGSERLIDLPFIEVFGMRKHKVVRMQPYYSDTNVIVSAWIERTLLV